MSDFRHLNVDQYDEEALYLADIVPEDPRSPQELAQIAQAKQGSARTRMASGDMVGALQEALHDPPTGSQALEARRMSWSLIFDILSSTRTADILTTVKALSGDERDTLMKYLYRGMELVRTPGEAGSINGAVLLSWHEKLTQVSGTGCIVRVMTDRRVV